MPDRPAVLLRHVGHGPAHHDLVCAGGLRCPTWHLHAIGRDAWRVLAGSPHRRRYLTYRGPVPGGRGRVTRVWTGRARWRGGRLILGALVLDLHHRPGVGLVATRRAGTLR